MVENPPARLASVLLWDWMLSAAGCVEGGSLAISAGAPATAAVEGRITDCGRALADADVVLRAQQDRPEQARPVDVHVGPVTTDRDGHYIVEVAPSFAIPGRASLQMQSVNGTTLELAGPDLSFTLGVPPRDTLRFNADVGVHRGSCR